MNKNLLTHIKEACVVTIGSGSVFYLLSYNLFLFGYLAVLGVIVGVVSYFVRKV